MERWDDLSKSDLAEQIASKNLVVSALKIHLKKHEIPGRNFVVGFSGGLDSTVLLHALFHWVESRNIAAIHINHGLQEHADSWAEHCKTICKLFGVEISIYSVSPYELVGEGPEDAARNARLKYFHLHAKQQERVFLGHHLGDQCETVLGNLFRGSGVEGLAGIPAYRGLSNGSIERPFLPLERRHLKNYALYNDLHWIEDPTNSCTSFDRNRVRHEVLPIIRKRWKSVDSSIARAAQNCQELSILGEQIARQDIAECIAPQIYFPVSRAPVLDLVKLDRLTIERRINLLRWWIASNSSGSLSRNRFQEVLNQLANLNGPASGGMSWNGWHLHRYRQYLYLSPEFQSVERKSCNWDGVSKLEILGTDLVLISVLGSQSNNSQYRVSFANDDARMRFDNRGCSKSVRNLFQENAITPMIRSLLPRIFWNDKLVCIVGVVSVDDFDHRSYHNRWSLQLKAEI